MISWTSPRDSAIGLPTSRVTSWESASLLDSKRRPTWAITRLRARAGTFAHSFWAARAAAHASTNVAASASPTSATTSSSLAGLVGVRWPPGASVRASPPITEAIVGAPDAASARELSSVDMSSTLSSGELSFEALDRGDVDRVGPGEHGHVERHEVSEQHERDLL